MILYCMYNKDIRTLFSRCGGRAGEPVRVGQPAAPRHLPVQGLEGQVQAATRLPPDTGQGPATTHFPRYFW